MASDSDRSVHLEWLTALTRLPTAAGREHRVVEWISDWVASRPDLSLTRDAVGNLTVAPEPRWGSGEPPVYIEAHMDHPAFVVNRVIGPGTVELIFRGGVMDVFFRAAPIVLHPEGGDAIRATLADADPEQRPPFKACIAELEDGSTDAVRVGDIGTWELPAPRIDSDGILHAPACDDLAGVAAALCALETLRRRRAAGERVSDVRLLFTRAEEVGFMGAIAACREGTIPEGSRIIALENSRAFPESPIGAGPIVRVGDRMSIFSPRLTNACARCAEELFGGPSIPRASEGKGAAAKRPWQRKLMPGGGCEASVFCAFGYESTCLCLPLGNYHNMAHLSELQAGDYDAGEHGPARAAPEFISVEDFHALVDLLAAIGQRLPSGDVARERIDKLFEERSFVLDEK